MNNSGTASAVHLAHLSPGLRLANLLAIVAMVLNIAWPALAIAQDSGDEMSETGVVVSTPDLVIRSCPSPSCDVVQVLNLGDTMVVTGASDDGYLPVRVGDQDGYAWSLFVASPSNGTPVLERGTAGCNRVALIFNLGRGSFDDPFSWNMVDYLVAESVPATMFARAWWASYYPAWAYEFDQAGFVVGIHGEPGLSLDDQTAEAAMSSIVDAQTRLEAAIGHAVDPVFTPFDRDTDPEVLSMVALAGLLPVIGDVQGFDGHDSGASAETVTANVLENVYDGAIIELHLDSPTAVSSTATALPGIVASLREQGYTFVTIPDLAQPCPAD